MGRKPRSGNAAPADEAWTESTLAGKTKEEFQKIYEDLGGETPDGEYFSSASDEVLIEAILKLQADAGGSDDEPKVDAAQGDKDNLDPPLTPPKKEGEGKERNRIRNRGLNGSPAVIGGEVVYPDADGVFEVDAAQAARLLTIPGWEEA
jgi:hypothetical protein